MGSIGDVFSSGGIPFLLVLVFGILHAIPILVQLFVAKKADFTPYLWGGLACILVIGLIGMLHGANILLMNAHGDIPDIQAAGIAAGMQRIMITGLATAVMLLPGVLFTGIATSLTRNLTPSRRHD